MANVSFKDWMSLPLLAQPRLAASTARRCLPKIGVLGLNLQIWL